MSDTSGPLEISGLSVRLGDRQVLDDVSFTVPAGRVVGLLGPNGAGKTTTMRVLFGIVAPDHGDVRWRGRPAGDADRARWGYMPQERGLYMKMSARDHLVYLGRLRGVPRDDLDARIEDLLERVDLADRADDRIERLSGGMQQRVQLAAALVHRPDVLVLDEPFAGLDPVAVEQLAVIIAEQASAGRTVLFSSHQLDLVEDVCDTIVLVNEGRVVLDGELAELKAASEQRTLRIGVQGTDPSWVDRLDGTGVVHRDANEVVLRLDPDTDPLAVLDRARGLGQVYDFGLELPRLSQLFREAVGS